MRFFKDTGLVTQEELKIMIKEVENSNLNGVRHHVMHPNHKYGCVQQIFMRYLQLNKNSHDIYFPVHFLLFLLRLRKVRKLEDFKKILMRFVKGYIKSILFAGFYGISVPLIACKVDIKTKASAFFGPMFFSSAILFEDKYRWAEMSMWVAGQWIESMMIFGHKSKIIPVIPGFSRYLFAISMGVFAQCYFTKGYIPRKFGFLMKCLVGEIKD